MANVLVISTSFRKNSNSDILSDEFIKGAAEAGHNVEKINLSDKTINFCKGCLACQKTQKCVINDDAREIAEKVLNADILVFATPIYYYSVSGQLKTLIDRLNPLYSADYKFRKVYLIATAAEDEKETVKGTITAIKGFIECFERSTLAGVIFAGGVNMPGEIKGHPALIEAYNIGKSL